MAAVKNGSPQSWQYLPVGVFPLAFLLWRLNQLTNLKPEKTPGQEWNGLEVCNLTFCCIPYRLLTKSLRIYFFVALFSSIVLKKIFPGIK